MGILEEQSLLRENGFSQDPKKWTLAEAVFAFDYFGGSEQPLVLPSYLHYVKEEGYLWRNSFPDVIVPEVCIRLDALARLNEIQKEIYRRSPATEMEARHLK